MKKKIDEIVIDCTKINSQAFGNLLEEINKAIRKLNMQLYIDLSYNVSKKNGN